jgi:hypothetical protein
MRLKALITVLWALVGLGITLSCEAATGSGGETASDAIQSATKWSTELVANQWAWRLTKYRELWAAYKIDGQTSLLLSSDPTILQTKRIFTDSVLWNLLTGEGRHFSADELEQFRAAYENQQVSTWNSTLHLSGGRTLKREEP